MARRFLASTPLRRPSPEVFDGLGHQLGNLVISNKTANNLGLFSEIGTSGVVRNVTLSGGSLTGGDNLSHFGMLTGWNLGSVANITSGAGVTSGNGSQSTGGLIGANYGTLSNGVASGATVSGTNALAVGGAVGVTIGGTITGSTASGSVSAGAGALWPGRSGRRQ